MADARLRGRRRHLAVSWCANNEADHVLLRTLDGCRTSREVTTTPQYSVVLLACAHSVASCLPTLPQFWRPAVESPRGKRTRFSFTALTDFAVELSGLTGRVPRVCLLATAMGDDKAVLHYLTEAAQSRGFAPSHVALFPMPTVEDITAHLLDQDVVGVFGGSVAGLLAMWRLHGVDDALRTAWQAGVVLTGISAGSICWHAGGATDSFGPRLQPVTNGLGFVPYANGVHYDSEEQRRPFCTQWWVLGCCLTPMPPTTARGCSIVAPRWWKLLPKTPLPGPTSSKRETVPQSRRHSMSGGCRRCLTFHLSHPAHQLPEPHRHNAPETPRCPRLKAS